MTTEDRNGCVQLVLLLLFWVALGVLSELVRLGD